MEHRVKHIQDNSIAAELGISVGDYLLQVNGKPVHDILEYIYEIASEYVEITIKNANDEIIIYEIEKEYDEKIGLEFVNPILDQPNSCKNKCVFCFIDQLPSGMRRSLYFKDDDSRLSFLHGNYITLTNLSEEDLNRIIELKISPINVSVHTTNPDLRLKMIKNPKALDMMPVLKKLTEADIEVNGQIVLCPGFNDGSELERSIQELYDLGENFSNLAIVPVGISKHRKGLEKLTPVTEKIALETIDLVKGYQQHAKKQRGKNFVYLSDEFYLLSKMDFPKYDEYDGFPQIENGVGLTVKLNYEVEQALKQYPSSNKNASFTIITGKAAAPNMKKIANRIHKKFSNIKVDIKAIRNDFFGPLINVAGLVTGQDIIKQVNPKTLKESIILPEVMMKDNENVFLDDVTLEMLEKKLNRKIYVVPNNGYELIDRIVK